MSGQAVFAVMALAFIAGVMTGIAYWKWYLRGLYKVMQNIKRQLRGGTVRRRR